MPKSLAPLLPRLGLSLDIGVISGKCSLSCLQFGICRLRRSHHRGQRSDPIILSLSDIYPLDVEGHARKLLSGAAREGFVRETCGWSRSCQ